jgi:hypothetical protein
MCDKTAHDVSALPYLGCYHLKVPSAGTRSQEPKCTIGFAGRLYPVTADVYLLEQPAAGA